MADVTTGLFGRKCTLQISNSAGDILDLSEFRIVFHIEAHDESHPGSAVIRVYNLRADTVNRIRSEYQVVSLQAGYQEGGLFGAIFVGSIKQFRIGKEDSVTTYLDLLCADQDVFYNASPIAQSFSAGSNPQRIIAAIVTAANNQNQSIINPAQPITTNPATVKFLNAAGINPAPRGKVVYGACGAHLKSTAASLNASFSIQKGVLQIIPFTAYLPGEPIELTQFSGVVGIPEVTNEGIKIKCLLNPKIQVGATIKLNNALVNQIVIALGNIISGRAGGSQGIAYGSYGAEGPQFYANVGLDAALYRVLVTEYEGDTRGHPWYVTIIALLADPSSQTVITNTQGG